MADNDTYVVIKDKKKNNNLALLVLFGILFFIVIYFPLFGSTLRFSTGNILSSVFNGIGTICVTFGGLLMAWGFCLVVSCKSTRYVGMMVIGFILMYVGGFLVAPGTFVGIGPEIPQGYH